MCLGAFASSLRIPSLGEILPGGKLLFHFFSKFGIEKDMRFGKMQEFILTRALLKVQGKLPPGWKSPNVWGVDEEASEFGKKYKKHFQTVLLKSEILLNYYDLELSGIPSKILGHTHFKSTKKYHNARTDSGKCLKGLQRIGLIDYGFTPTQIRLTRKGKEVAESLLEMKGRPQQSEQKELLP
jgi:hypothetical protein